MNPQLMAQLVDIRFKVAEFGGETFDRAALAYGADDQGDNEQGEKSFHAVSAKAASTLADTY